jgi:hypothetical protein
MPHIWFGNLNAMGVCIAMAWCWFEKEKNRGAWI